MTHFVPNSYANTKRLSILLALILIMMTLHFLLNHMKVCLEIGKKIKCLRSDDTLMPYIFEYPRVLFEKIRHLMIVPQPPRIWEFRK